MDNEEMLQSKSPIPQEPAKPITYLFTDALREVLNGRRVTRLAWGNDEIYGVMDAGVLCIYGGEKGDGIMHPWTLAADDMTADDWIIL